MNDIHHLADKVGKNSVLIGKEVVSKKMYIMFWQTKRSHEWPLTLKRNKKRSRKRNRNGRRSKRSSKKRNNIRNRKIKDLISEGIFVANLTKCTMMSDSILQVYINIYYANTKYNFQKYVCLSVRYIYICLGFAVYFQKCWGDSSKIIGTVKSKITDSIQD
jgi:hypothetical protein